MERDSYFTRSDRVIQHPTHLNVKSFTLVLFTGFWVCVLGCELSMKSESEGAGGGGDIN